MDVPIINPKKTAFHLAGIVPVHTQPSDFKMPWHDCLMPIAQDYTAVERAVIECAYAGCETIWIISNDDMSPLVKYRLGEWVRDPVVEERENSHHMEVKIPIFYVPLNSIDRKKRDTLSWNILYGAWTAFWTARRISKWVIPKKYFVSFPYGVYKEKVVHPHRVRISSKGEYYSTFNDKSVKDGEYLSFTFNGEQFKKYKRLIRSHRDAARHLELAQIFGSDTMVEDATKNEVPWYYPINNWENYCNYLGSEDRKEIVRPNKKILTSKNWNRLGIADEE
jgi:hypothetical protein